MQTNILSEKYTGPKYGIAYTSYNDVIIYTKHSRQKVISND